MLMVLKIVQLERKLNYEYSTSLYRALITEHQWKSERIDNRSLIRIYKIKQNCYFTLQKILKVYEELQKKIMQNVYSKQRQKQNS